MKEQNFNMILKPEYHQKAQQLSQIQHLPHRAKQTYLNTLAIYVVNQFLQNNGIETDIFASDSHNPIMILLSNVADLQIKNLGKLECRAILENQDFVEIEPHVWSNRIGYIAVAINQSFTSAIIKGFISQVNTEKTPITNFTFSSNQYLLNLLIVKNWLLNFDANWLNIDQVFNPQSHQFAFRSKQTIKDENLNTTKVKILEFENCQTQIGLVMGISSNYNLDDNAEIEIFTEIYPLNQPYLPSELKLMILDEEKNVVMNDQTKEKDTKLIFEFTGSPGEHFSVNISLGEYSLTKTFKL